MIKFLYTGDWHIRGNNPRNRIDDYKEAAKRKLREVFSLAQEHQADAILVPGDIFDRPEVTIGVLLEFVSVLKESTVPIFTTAGNHDIYGYNLDTYERSSLKLLEMLVPYFKVVNDSADIKIFTDGKDTAAEVSFMPYSSKMDINGYGYTPEGEYTKGPIANYRQPYRIHVAHGMLLDHIPPFDRYTHLDYVETEADLVLTGHCHTGYGIYHRKKDGKVFCNPGALLRISASNTEIERPVRVALIEIDKKELKSITLLKIKSALPGDEVLDRSRIEAQSQRQYNMDQFSALIQRNTGEKVLIDVNQIVETIAVQEKFSPDVVKTALETIDAQRELIKN